MGLFKKSTPTGDKEFSVNCGETLDISKAVEFQKQLQDALGKGCTVVFEAAELGRIDAVSLQLFASFFNEAAARKVTAKWLSPSDSLVYAASLLGLTKHLGLPEYK